MGGSLSGPTVIVEMVDQGSYSTDRAAAGFSGATAVYGGSGPDRVQTRTGATSGFHCARALNLSLDARHRTVLEISGAVWLAAVVGQSSR
jgi:hypothetical protein